MVYGNLPVNSFRSTSTMARPKNTVPTYRQHKSSNTARCWVAGRWVTLGRYNSPESRAEFARIVGELAVAPIPSSVISLVNPDQTMNEILLAFWRHAEKHYRDPEGNPTNELPQFSQTFSLVKRLYGHTLAKEFGPLALKSLRQEMIGAGWSRKLINQRIGRVKRVFKWAVSEQLVPVEVFQALQTVTGLQQGRTKARDLEPIAPVADKHVLATLPFLQPAVRAMVAVQLLTGMRPGEVCRLCPALIEKEDSVWLFRPRQHKTGWQGKKRVVAMGPRAQALLANFTPSDPSEYFFSPERVVQAFHAARAATRKTKRYPKQEARNAANRATSSKRKPGQKYKVTSYEKAIARAVERANLPFIEAAVDVEYHIPAWHPNQLRHSLGTNVRHLYGLEAAQVVLGHSKADVTQVYAERNLRLAVKVASEIG
ncbi:MAG: hypothetical protein C0467_21575 [Planctomycetaceae bacterium]|nr:hypothetical protein [Planctomycetaceae bacterium]